MDSANTLVQNCPSPSTPLSKKPYLHSTLSESKMPALASPKSIRQLRDSLAHAFSYNSTPQKQKETGVSPLLKNNSSSKLFQTPPRINISNKDENNNTLEDSSSTPQSSSWKGDQRGLTKGSVSPLNIFPDSTTDTLKVATSPTRGRRFSDNNVFTFNSVSECEQRDEYYTPGTPSKRKSITKQVEFEDVSSPTTSSTCFAEIRTRKRGSTLPTAYQTRSSHKSIPKACQKTVFEVIFHRDLFIEVSEFLEWKDLLSLTHSCSLLFDMGESNSFVWKHKLLSTHKKLSSNLLALEDTIREKSQAASVYCHFETFREVYDSMIVATENKTVKCFEQMFEVMHIEGTQYSNKTREESNEKWNRIEMLFSRTDSNTIGSPNTILKELNSSLFPFPSTTFPEEEEKDFHQFSTPFSTSSMAHLIDKTINIYQNVKYPTDWKGIVEYFYSAESFFDACMADFSKIKKIYEYFHLSFKPYPELLIMNSHYLNYNENAKAGAFSSPVRAFVGWSFFYGKFLESNMDLVTMRQNILQERTQLEKVTLPFIFKKMERDNSI